MDQQKITLSHLYLRNGEYMSFLDWLARYRSIPIPVSHGELRDRCESAFDFAVGECLKIINENGVTRQSARERIEALRCR